MGGERVQMTMGQRPGGPMQRSMIVCWTGQLVCCAEIEHALCVHSRAHMASQQSVHGGALSHHKVSYSIHGWAMEIILSPGLSKTHSRSGDTS